MSVTSIEWCDVTWNPVRGCSRVSEGCRNCYAEAMAARNLPEMRSPSTGESFARSTPAGPRWTGRVELIPSKLDEPLGWRKPRRVFVNSMSDLFHESLPNDAIAAVFGVMASAPAHTFLILTKRPQRMREWFAWVDSQPAQAGCGGGNVHPFSVIAWAATLQGVPGVTVERLYEQRGGGSAPWPLPNVWLGVSVEEQATADERIPELIQTPAVTRFVSFEPALGPVDFGAWLQGPPCPTCGTTDSSIGVREERWEPGRWYCRRPGCTEIEGFGWWGIDQIIVGGEAGRGARAFDVAIAHSVVHQCDQADQVWPFVKQLGRVPVMAEAVWKALHPTPLLNARNHKHTPPGFVPLALKHRKGSDMSEWPEALRRREFPR